MKGTKSFFRPETLVFVLTFMVILVGCSGGNPASDFRWSLNPSGGVTIIGYVGSSQIVKIPAKINGKQVTVIGEKAFELKQLNSVTIPNSVIEIEKLAFADNLLNSVIIPNSVTSIEYAAFRDNQLTSVTIGQGVYIESRGIFEGNLKAVYDNNGKQSGTYRRAGDT